MTPLTWVVARAARHRQPPGFRCAHWATRPRGPGRRRGVL